MMTSEAWYRGEAKAREELAKMPPDDGTITVSVSDYHTFEGRRYFKLCRACGWARTEKGCHCPG